MTPSQLDAGSFRNYGGEAQAFATVFLALLQRLPLVLCPSFLQQIEKLGTSFPAEKASLDWQCRTLATMPSEHLAVLLKPFDLLVLSQDLQRFDWLHDPATFVTQFTAFLWSSQQINAFHAATQALFAAIPPMSAPHRLTIVTLGKGAPAPSRPALKRLRTLGVSFSELDAQTMPEQILAAVQEHAAAAAQPYAHWYVDGAEPWPLKVPEAHKLVNVMSYTALAPLRKSVLDKMQTSLTSDAGAEQLHSRMAGITAADLNAGGVTADPVLQRFYTELFTQSSGPQLFSTSFVQWSGRELARRAQPHTLLLRYTPRQRQRSFNDLVEKQGTELDPEGSLRDAEMGAYYNWLEMQRISVRGGHTFVAWLEGTADGVLLGASAPAGSLCTTPCSLKQALEQFG